MITQHNQRLFYSDDGTLTDVTLLLNDFRKGTFNVGNWVAAEDYLYIGSDLPFSHKYIDITTANSATTDMAIDIWDGNSWEPAVDVLDETASAGVSLAQSGIVSWKADQDETWAREGDSQEDISDLSSGPPIYCFYWLRIKFTVDLSVGTIINHIGYLFNNDDELYSIYPDLQNTQTLDCFEPMAASGTKTSWKEQSFIASQELIRQMRSSNIVWSPAQIVNFEILKNAAIHKTAEIIYAALGEPYEFNRKTAMERYSQSFNLNKFDIDTDRNARLSPREKGLSTVFARR